MKSASLRSQGHTFAAKNISYQKEEETVTFEFEHALQVSCFLLHSTLEVGAAELHVEYKGNLNDKMAGFYRSKYIVDKETR